MARDTELTLRSVPDAPDLLDFQPDDLDSLVGLLRTVRQYMYLDDPRLVWFSLAVATSAFLTDSEPLWGMLVGAPSGGKTESIRLVEGLAHETLGHVTEPGLLGWDMDTSTQIGTLTRIPDPAFVLVPDFSTVLTGGDRDQRRDDFFSALRRVYDGRYDRNLGGIGRVLTWQGRLTMLAAVTPTIDRYTVHADALGPRWLYFRLPSRDLHGKIEAARFVRLEHRSTFRKLAQEVVNQVVPRAASRAMAIQVPKRMTDSIDEAAMICAYGRAAVHRDAYGSREITDVPVAEETPRLAHQMTMLARCLLALELEEGDVIAFVRRCAADSMPAVRRACLTGLGNSVENTTTANAVAVIAKCDRKTVLRAMEELQAVGLVDGDDDEQREKGRFTSKSWWLQPDFVKPVRTVFREAAR